MRVRIFSVLSTMVATFIFAATAAEMRADVVYSNFGSGQSYKGNSWWNVGDTTDVGNQVDAFSFVPTETATLTGADLALTVVGPSSNSAPGSYSPLTVYIESSVGGQPGAIVDTLTQSGSYSAFPTTSVVDFTCSTCSVLDEGTTYWIVATQTDGSNSTGWLYNITGDTGTWYYNGDGSSTGPWTTATAGNTFSAFDVDGTAIGPPPATPEPGSLVLLGSGLLGMVAVGRRRFVRP